MKFWMAFFVLLTFCVSAQDGKIDFKNIRKNIGNPKSLYSQDRLIFKYKMLPASLDSLEARHLYYGRNFISSKVSTMDAEFSELAAAFKNNSFAECIRLGKILYNRDPTNLDVLLILLKAYDFNKDGSSFAHHMTQLRLLTQAIKDSGDGQSRKTAYLVNSVGDEYIFLNIMNVGKDFKRTSEAVSGGMLDIWEKDGTKIYIRVLYLDL